MKNNYYHIAILPGDGIGPEIIKQSYKILEVIKNKFHINIHTTEHIVGGSSIDSQGTPLSEDTIKSCEKSNAILLGSVGGPKWNYLDKTLTPECGTLLALRKHFNLFINIRPVYLPIELISLSPLKPEIISNGLDIMCIRELTGDIYFGKPRGHFGTGSQEYAFDTAIYHRFEIERIAHFAFKLAQKRRLKLTSIDKANVLYTSTLWRKVISELAKNYSNVQLTHLYVDNAAMQIIRNPSKFDVILCPNLFGDILSDECAIISGTIGTLPSASLNEHNFGLYEPAGGSAPDIAGKNIANPIAQILSTALLFKYSLKLNYIATSIETAVYKALKLGYRTIDMINNRINEQKNYVSTDEMGNIIAELIYTENN